MSTADFDAAIERAVHVIAIKMCDYPRTVHEELARVVLEACGWEDAARIAAELAAVGIGDHGFYQLGYDDSFGCRLCDSVADELTDPDAHEPACAWRRALKWVAQYTPTSEGTQ